MLRPAGRWVDPQHDPSAFLAFMRIRCRCLEAPTLLANFEVRLCKTGELEKGWQCAAHMEGAWEGGNHTCPGTHGVAREEEATKWVRCNVSKLGGDSL